MPGAEFSDPSMWLQLAVGGSALAVGSGPAAPLSGSIEAYGLFMNAAVLLKPTTLGFQGHMNYAELRAHAPIQSMVYYCISTLRTVGTRFFPPERFTT